MFFTQDDYKKIQQWLTKNSVKDTEFNEANMPFNGEETITIVQGNQNKKVFLKDLIAQVFNLGISDFINITDKYNAPNISLEEAIKLIPSRARKEGQVITFSDIENHWYIYQFKGTLNQWNILDQWSDLFKDNYVNSILPDEEDLTKSSPDENGNSYLSFKDKRHNKLDFSGLGKVYLRKNIINGVNTLLQKDINKDNTIYIIQYDYDLNGGTVEIPENCVLQFDGGSISNGTMVGSNTIIEAGLVKVFGTDVTIKGVWNIECWYPEWFGAKSNDESFMSTKAIQAALDAAKRNIKVVKLTGADYYIDDTLVVHSYQSLVGESSSVHHYGGIRINQTVNKHAIQLTSTDIDIWQICLKDFTINNKYKGVDMNNCGIYVYNGDVQTCFYHNEITNVCCTYFDKGFMYDGFGDGAFAYNYFHEFAAYYNKIGLHIKGSPSSDTSVTKYPWCNLNRWSFCKFMGNSIGGIYFEMTRSQQENIFESCSIEGNGRNYTLSDYDFYGCAGFAFRGKGKSCYGFTRFYNCYIENNIPKRDESLGYEDSSREYSYAGWIYPNDIEENTNNAAFSCYKQSIEVKDCLLSKYVRLYSGNLEFKVRFESNDYDFGYPWYKNIPDASIDYFFYFNMNQGYINYCDIYINEFFSKGDRDSSYPNLLTKVTNVFLLSESNRTYGFRGMKMEIHHPNLEKPIILKGTNKNRIAEIDDCIIYIDNINGKVDSLGISKNHASKTLARAEQISSFFTNGKEVEWVLLNDYNDNGDYWDAGGNNHPVYMRGESNVSYTSSRRTLYTPHIFENITFNSNVQHHHIFETYADRIEFRNCTFNIPTSYYYIARTLSGSCDMFFINCKFNLLDTSSGTKIKIYNDRFANSNVHLSNCKTTDGVTIDAKCSSWDGGSEINKRTGDIVLALDKYYCVFDGTDVINPDGSLFTKARFVKNISDINSGETLYKIIKDIDLEGKTVSLPWRTKLDFQGGRFINGVIAFDEARLLPMGMPMSYYIDTENCSVEGEYWAIGQVLYDSALKKQKLWNGTAWVNLDGTPLTDSANTVGEQTE